MYAQLLGIFGILATTALASPSSPTIDIPAAFASPAAANPAVTPAALFAVGDNVIAQAYGIMAPGGSGNEDDVGPLFTNAHTFTLNLTENTGTVIGVDLWAPPSPGSTFLSSEEGNYPTSIAHVSYKHLLHTYRH